VKVTIGLRDSPTSSNIDICSHQKLNNIQKRIKILIRFNFDLKMISFNIHLYATLCQIL
jgi:hypothetical protein